MGVGPKVVTELFNMIDVDANGSIDYREFKEAFGEGICGSGYEGMDVFRGEESHIANIASRSQQSNLRDMELESAIHELRTRMATQHIKVRTAFRALDKDSSGTLEKRELLMLLQNYHIQLSDKDIDQLISRMDTDKSGKISYREFSDYFGADIAGGQFSNTSSLESTLETTKNRMRTEDSKGTKELTSQHHKNWTTSDFMNAMEAILMTRARTVRRIFRVADNDKSGCIDAEEWHKALGQMNLEMSAEKAREFFDALDKNGDGRINYHEFVAAFGEIVAGYRDTGIMAASLDRHKDKAQFGNSMCQPRYVPRVPRHTVSQIRELVARRLGGKYKSARAAFRNIDLDKGGYLDQNEFRRFIKTLNVELLDADYEKLFEELDQDNSGHISYKEFLFWFGEAICGAPWQAKQSTGLCTTGMPRIANRMPKPKLLSSQEALRLLHLKLTETSTSVNKVFKRYNQGRSTKLSRKQFKVMFDNYHLHVNDEVVSETVKHIQRSHGALPMDGSGVTFPLFVKEFGKSIAGEAFVGTIDPSPLTSSNSHRPVKSTPKCTAKQARVMLMDKLATNFKHNRTVFNRFNLARNHAMTRDELRHALTYYHIHLNDDEFQKFVKEFDKDGNGVIDFREFISIVGAEVSGSPDNGLSATMQAADDRQKQKTNELRKQLRSQNFETSDSEPTTDGEENAPLKNDPDRCQPRMTSELKTCPQKKVPKTKQHAPPSPNKLYVANTKRRLHALTRPQSAGLFTNTTWDIRDEQTPSEQATSLLHHPKQWRIPSSRPVKRVVAHS